MHIGDRIKAKRISLGWSQRDLAERMGYKNHSVVARIEAGKVDLPQSRVDQFAKVLGLSHGYLLGLVSEEVNKKNDQIVELVAMLRREPDFFATVVQLAELDPAQRANIQGIISALGKK